MKKMDWFVALFFMALGLMCLMVSASYYQVDSISSGLGFFRSACIWIAILGVVVYVIYRLVRFKQGGGK